MLNDKPLTAASDNLLMWRMGEACRAAADAPAGDLIDRGLILLRLLNEKGFDVVQRAHGVPEVQPVERYTVEGNRCRCHPETCACAPWRVLKDGERFLSAMTRAAADAAAAALNGANGVDVGRGGER